MLSLCRDEHYTDHLSILIGSKKLKRNHLFSATVYQFRLRKEIHHLLASVPNTCSSQDRRGKTPKGH